MVVLINIGNELKLNVVWFKKETMSENIWMILLFAYAINLFGYGVYLPFILIFPVALYFIKGKFSRLFLINVFVLLSFSSVFVLVLHLATDVTFGNKLMYLVFPITLFLFGHKIGGRSIDYIKMLKFSYLIIASFAIFALLSYMNTINIYGNYESSIISLKGRYVLSIWDSSLIVATGLNTYLSLGLSLLGLLFLNSKGIKKSKFVKLMSLLLFVICIYVAFIAGNRTSIVLFITSFVVVIFFTSKFSFRKIGAVLSVVSILALSNFALSKNLFNIKSHLQSSYLYDRFNEGSLVDDPRVKAWGDALQAIFKNPIKPEGTQTSLNFAHNMWLDVGLLGGGLPFLLLCSFNLICLFVLIVFLKSNHPIMMKGLMLGLFTTFYLQFFVEPIFQGWLTYFNVFCFFAGMLSSVNFNYKRDLYKYK